MSACPRRPRSFHPGSLPPGRAPASPPSCKASLIIRAPPLAVRQPWCEKWTIPSTRYFWARSAITPIRSVTGLKAKWDRALRARLRKGCSGPGRPEDVAELLHCQHRSLLLQVVHQLFAVVWLQVHPEQTVLSGAAHPACACAAPPGQAPSRPRWIPARPGWR